MPKTRKKLLIAGVVVIASIATVVVAVSLSGSVPVEDVSVGAPDGMNATLYGQTNLSMENMFPDSRTVDLTTEDGNITFASDSPAWASVHKDDITGTETKITEITTNGSFIEINPEDKQRVDVRGETNILHFKDVTLDDGTSDLYYSGTDGETAYIRVHGQPTNTQLVGIDANTETILDINTTDGAGVLPLSMPTSSHNVLLQTTDDTVAPGFANPNPTGNPTIRWDNETLSIDVSDADFPSDEVNTTLYLDGSQVHTENITSNLTVSTTVTGLSDGAYSWHAEAVDAYGNTKTSETHEFTVNHYNPNASNIQPEGELDVKPSEITVDVEDKDFAFDGDTLDVNIDLDNGTETYDETINANQTVDWSMPSAGQLGGSHTIDVTVTDSYGQTETLSGSYVVPHNFNIRNETNHTQLISADGEVQFFGDNDVYSRTAPNGTLNMTGLPVDQDFIVKVSPTKDNMTERTIYVNSIYEQQNAYVLNTTHAETIDVRFVLNDPTGQYSPQALLKIQRPIDIDGSTEYQTIVADEFGAEGLTPTLEKSVRYRLLVTEDGDAQVVGPYRGEVAGETIVVEPGNPEIDLSKEESGLSVGANLDEDNQFIEYQYVDEEDDTDSLTVWVHERGNTSNNLQPNETYFNLGSISDKADMTKDELEKEWVVKFIYDRGDGEKVIVESLAGQFDLTMPLDGPWRSIAGISMLVLLAGAFSVLNVAVGAIVVSLAGGLLWWLGFLGGATSAIAVAIAVFISAVLSMAGGGGPR